MDSHQLTSGKTKFVVTTLQGRRRQTINFGPIFLEQTHMNPWVRLIEEIQFSNQYQPNFRNRTTTKHTHTRYTKDLLRDIYTEYTQIFGDCYSYSDFLYLCNEPLSKTDYARLKMAYQIEKRTPKRTTYDNIFVC